MATFTLLILSLAWGNQNWKLQELAQASNALVVDMDSISSGKKSHCGLTSEKISRASQNLQSLIDQRIKELKKQKLKVEKLLKTCEADCTCDIYEYALEKLTDQSKPQENPVLFSAAQRKSCFQKLKNFCKSNLLINIL